MHRGAYTAASGEGVHCFAQGHSSGADVLNTLTHTKKIEGCALPLQKITLLPLFMSLFVAAWPLDYYIRVNNLNVI